MISKLYKSEIENLSKSCKAKKVKIYSASKLGWFICKVLEKNDIPVEGFIDQKDFIQIAGVKNLRKYTIRNFFETKDAITACNICNYHHLANSELVAPAIQLSS